MKITITPNGRDVRISLMAETAAEAFQLDAINAKLYAAGAHAGEWDDMHGSSGLYLVVEKLKPATD